MSAAASPEEPSARGAVAKAAREWAESLIDQTRRNELLHCKDKGKILLDDADPAALDRLVRGEPVRLRQLFADALAGTDAADAVLAGTDEADAVLAGTDAGDAVLAGTGGGGGCRPRTAASARPSAAGTASTTTVMTRSPRWPPGSRRTGGRAPTSNSPTRSARTLASATAAGSTGGSPPRSSGSSGRRARAAGRAGGE